MTLDVLESFRPVCWNPTIWISPELFPYGYIQVKTMCQESFLDCVDFTLPHVPRHSMSGPLMIPGTLSFII